ncbi:ethanolamine utilization protein EutH [uncultured Citricoccus sp.]|uniref:ethanolamine utilization protein EutH n=1 Tax=uncultured Citricoccus sp. TaxID=614031 RepID=UPI00262657B0|nr:ethanolamine utilization protein EutH [uncultured Citricoccus sp.]
MEIIGQVIIYVMMAFVLIGAVAAIVNDDKGLGREFKEGIYSIGVIFLPVAGIMVFMPYLTQFVVTVLGPVYAWLHADPSLAATTIIAGDMGGYQLAHETAGSHGAWLMAFATSLTAGATIIYSIPVGLAMLDKRDHKYMALGFMSGLLTIPVAVFTTTLMLQLTQTPLRTEVSTEAPSVKPFDLGWGDIFLNLVPLAIFMVVLALCLRFFTDFMVKAFIVFGRVIDGVIKIGLALAVVEYFTGIFSTLFGGWGLDPFIADEENQFRALEIAGYIGVMLAGAFPLVYAIRTWLARPLTVVGAKVGFTEEGAAGVIAGVVNIQAMFRLIKTMPPRDKVLCTAFAVCGAFSFGDHLAFIANFQPNMVFPFIVGKVGAGLLAMVLAVWLSLPETRKLEAQDLADGTIEPGEYSVPGEIRRKASPAILQASRAPGSEEPMETHEATHEDVGNQGSPTEERTSSVVT